MTGPTSGVAAHPDRGLLSAGDLGRLLDFVYRCGEMATFAELARIAVEVVSSWLGGGCRVGIHEFGADGSFVDAYVSGMSQDFHPGNYGGTAADAGATTPPLGLAGLRTGPWLTGGIRGLEPDPEAGNIGSDPDVRREMVAHYQACLWITLSREGFTLLGLDRGNSAFSGRDMAMIGEVRNVLAVSIKRLRQIDRVPPHSGVPGEGSPVCGWVEFDVNSWKALRMAGPVEGWLAATRAPDEAKSGVPMRLRAPIEAGKKSGLLGCPLLAGEKIGWFVLPGIVRDRLTVVMHFAGRRSMRCEELTRREREVFSLASTGQSRGEIALLLGISKRTVDKHFEHIYEKLGVSGGGIGGLVRHGFFHEVSNGDI